MQNHIHNVDVCKRLRNHSPLTDKCPCLRHFWRVIFWRRYQNQKVLNNWKALNKLHDIKYLLLVDFQNRIEINHKWPIIEDFNSTVKSFSALQILFNFDILYVSNSWSPSKCFFKNVFVCCFLARAWPVDCYMCCCMNCYWLNLAALGPPLVLSIDLLRRPLRFLMDLFECWVMLA